MVKTLLVTLGSGANWYQVTLKGSGVPVIDIFHRQDTMGKCDKKTTFEILDYFFEQGGNFIDT